MSLCKRKREWRGEGGGGGRAPVCKPVYDCSRHVYVVPL